MIGRDMKLSSPTLTGRHVQLEQLRPEHVGELVAAANEDRATYDWTAVPPTVDGMTAYVAGLLADQERGEVVPFAQRRLADGALVGCTRFLRLEWWTDPTRASPTGGDTTLPVEVEIGGTWLAPDAQRSAGPALSTADTISADTRDWRCA